MKTWGVSLPITGVAYVEVRADSEEEAIEAAMGGEYLDNESIQTWEAHRYVNRGNVVHGDLGEAEAQPIEDDDEEDGG
jgi:hypothetical protein